MRYSDAQMARHYGDLFVELITDNWNGMEDVDQLAARLTFVFPLKPGDD